MVVLYPVIQSLLPKALTFSILLISFNVAVADVYVSFVNSKKIEDYISSNAKFKKIPVIYQRNIDKNDDGVLDYENYNNYINKHLSGYTGPVVLDWEGKSFKKLSGYLSSSEGEMKVLINSVVHALDIIKSNQGMSAGMYGMPSRYSANLNRLSKEVKKLNQVYAKIDVFYPSLYLANNYKYEGKSISSRIIYLEKILKEHCGRKKIYPFIMHRWHPNSKKTPLGLISQETFDAYIKRIKAANYKGCRVDGVVWWGADGYWSKIGKLKESSMIGEDVSGYNKSVINMYMDKILKYFP